MRKIVFLMKETVITLVLLIVGHAVNQLDKMSPTSVVCILLLILVSIDGRQRILYLTKMFSLSTDTVPL